MLEVTQPREVGPQDPKRGEVAREARPAIVVLSRVTADETPSSFLLRGFLQIITSDSQVESRPTSCTQPPITSDFLVSNL